MISLPVGVPLVDVERSGVVESVHSGHVVVLEPDGEVRLGLGTIDAAIFPRSSLKPVQASGMAELGLELPPDLRALSAASHSGEPAHVAGVEAILRGAGLHAGDLRCPPDWPLSESAHEQALITGAGRARVRMNCSGKHAAMLAVCRQHDWPVDSYFEAEHPLQQALRGAVEDLSGEPVAATGVDGCGAPLFAISLLGLARAVGRIAAAAGGPEHDVAEAMRTHPWMVGGTGRSVTALMRGVPGLIAKDGAEGVYVAARPDGSAVAVKIDDGAKRAAEPAVVQALRILGVDAPVLDELAAAPVLGRGEVVGRIRVRSWD